MRVTLYPDLHYLTREHIPLWTVSVLVLAVLIVPFALLILLAPFLSRVCNLTRIKPLLDEFQSCFRDSFRWYLALYCFAWLALCWMLVFNEYDYMQMLLVFLVVSHVMTSPYQLRWLNIADNLLLTDLTILSSLFQQQNL